MCWNRRHLPGGPPPARQPADSLRPGDSDNPVEWPTKSARYHSESHRFESCQAYLYPSQWGHFDPSHHHLTHRHSDVDPSLCAHGPRLLRAGSRRRGWRRCSPQGLSGPPPSRRRERPGHLEQALRGDTRGGHTATRTRPPGPTGQFGHHRSDHPAKK